MIEKAVKNGLILPLLGGIVLSVAGCAYQPQKVSNPQLVAEADTVSLMLAEAAGKAATSLEALASVEQYRTPQAVVSTIPNAPQELRRGMTVNWVGPVEPMAKAIADKTGYQFNAIGDVPPAPIVVTVNAQNKQIIEVLRDMGLQLGGRGTLNVDANRRVIELQYAPTIGAKSF
jgi:defect-in-organelle-trafficking protein DotD